MNMVFRLSKKQSENLQQVINDSNAAYRKVLDNFCLEDYILPNESRGVTYYDDVRDKRYFWLGNILGFIETKNFRDIPDICVEVQPGKLIVVAERAAILRPEIMQQLIKILGGGWRLAMPEIDGETFQGRLFWWETTDDFCKWRAEWNQYFEWLIPQLKPNEVINRFDDRFPNENRCLQMLRSGQIDEARKTFPQVADQILSIA